MKIDWYLQGLALLGSLCVIVALVFHFKAQKDTNKTEKTWKQFFIGHWDDFSGMLFFGQVITKIRVYVYALIPSYFENESLWDVFYNHEQIICFSIGMFGIAIFMILYGLGDFFIKKGKKIIHALKS